MEAIESLGFVFLRHQLLERSHGLAFATAPLTDAELDARLAEAALPSLLLRREAEACEELEEEEEGEAARLEPARLPPRWGRRRPLDS